MAFDSATRNKLANLVTRCRGRLVGEFSDQFQQFYGIVPKEGTVAALDSLTHLDESQREIARQLHEVIDYYAEGNTGSDTQRRKEAIDRLLREQAFTVLNRLAALRMAEERDLVQECVRQGTKSEGFQLFEMNAGTDLGDAHARYVTYLECLYDELSLDLGVLFDRFSPHGLLFPGEAGLNEVLDFLGEDDIKHLWAEDETIGWIYQYWNSKEERKAMRDASAAPRNSRELAVRNQFFTPRYVVEFLTDNTLGRIWYEMTKGETRLAEQCRYLVRRPTEVFLGEGEDAPEQEEQEGLSQEELLKQPVHIPHRPVKDPREIRLLDPACGSMHFGLYAFDLFETIYDEAWQSDESLQDSLPQCFFEPESIHIRSWDDLRCDASDEPLTPDDAVVAIWPHDDLKHDRPGRMFIYSKRSAAEPDRRRRLSFVAPLADLDWARFLQDGWVNTGMLRQRLSQESFSCTKLTDQEAAQRFRQLIPRLIIEHNIHGVDIDPRAVQIAGLSLWLRAQKTWKDTPAAERPCVRRSNIVCAEPMPGSDAMLEDFVQTLDPPLLGELVKTVFDKMQLAGEAGTLLKIEEEIRTAIDDAKAKWEKLGAAERDLFSAEELNQTLRPGAQQELTGVEKALTTDHRPLATDFFDTAEERIYGALRNYAESAEAGDYQRRLFAEDAAHGFAFIDLCRKRYDTVVMNPPFGASSALTGAYMKAAYGDASSDLYACFVRRTLVLAGGAIGRVGAITNRTGFFIDQLAGWRESILTRVDLIADLGSGVLDALVEAAAYTIDSRAESKIGSGLAFEQLANSEKAAPLNRAVQSVQSGQLEKGAFRWAASRLQSIPGAPLAYWIHDDLLSIIQDTDTLDSAGFDAQIGVSTKDDFRFLRLRWEVSYSEIAKHWFTFAKGGEYSRYWSDLHLVINFRNSAYELDAYIAHKYPYLKGNTTWVIHPESGYFRPGLTYTRRTSSPISVRVLPSGSVFSDMGRGIVQESDDQNGLLSLLGIANTRAFRYFLELCVAAGDSAARTYEGGIVNQMPVCRGTKEIGETVYKLVAEKRSIVSAVENTALFSVPLPCLPNQNHEETSVSLQRDLEEAVRSRFDLCTEARAEIDSRISEEGHVEDFSDWVSEVPVLDGIASYCLGLSFGRWDIRYATGQRQPPELPDPFDPLPVCPPGMLQNADGLPAAPSDVPGDYPLPITWPGILVSDPGHPEDIVARVRDALAVIWVDRASAIEQEACDILGVGALRDYFAEKKSGGKFFKDHLKRYSKSRRQAPIYWPLSTESGSYTLWIYYHRLTGDTLFACITNFVEPKIESVSRDLERLTTKGDERSKAEDKEWEKLTDLSGELQVFRDELLRIANLPWKPNLNDGVQITAAPLWSLFRLKPWAKKLKDTWQKLEKGDYDWAHQCHTLWPERVIPKCATDRSLAIAHGYEQDLWEEVKNDKGKLVWQPKKNAEEIVKRLVSETN